MHKGRQAGLILVVEIQLIPLILSESVFVAVATGIGFGELLRLYRVGMIRKPTLSALEVVDMVPDFMEQHMLQDEAAQVVC